jgi:hypothetical protein
MSDDMPAGRELDALVAERVMLWSGVGNRPDRMSTYLGGDGWSGNRLDQGEVLSDIPYYSTAVGAAWLLVEGLDEDWCCSLQEHPAEYNEWACTFAHRRDALSVSGSANTAALAICRAALKAVGPTGSHVRPPA